MSLHTDRRTFLRRSALAAGAVWIAPVVTAVPAHAAVGSEPPRPPQTLPGEPVTRRNTFATVDLTAPAELAWTGNDQARLAALGTAAVATGAALVALNREDPREGHG